MKQDKRQDKRRAGDPPRKAPDADSIVALLAASGLRAEPVERCPEPACPVCSGGRRAAA
jgi:hypothetical protein